MPNTAFVSRGDSLPSWMTFAYWCQQFQPPYELCMPCDKLEPGGTRSAANAGVTKLRRRGLAAYRTASATSSVLARLSRRVSSGDLYMYPHANPAESSTVSAYSCNLVVCIEESITEFNANPLFHAVYPQRRSYAIPDLRSQKSKSI